MSSPEKGPKDRILETAVRLFQTQGYGNTGINQIIQESKTAKASFYDYFPSKDDLGKAYIEFYGKEQLKLLELLKKRSDSPKDFVLAWTQILRRQTRNSGFAGCPMANTAAQIASTSAPISEEVRKLALKTIDFLTSYLKELQQKGKLKKIRIPKLWQEECSPVTKEFCRSGSSPEKSPLWTIYPEWRTLFYKEKERTSVPLSFKEREI